MATENKLSQEQLLKTVADVLDEALAIYESEVGNDIQKSATPSMKQDSGIDAAMDMQAALACKPKAVAAPGIGDASTQGIMAKEEEDEEKKKKKEEMDKADAELVTMFKSIQSKLEARGLIQKTEAPIQKSETASDFASDLRKSMDERFASMGNALKDVAETVKKIASAPQARKGLTGLQPLKKTENAPAPLSKGEVVGKLLELKKNGDPRVNSLFITRVEQGRLMKGDDDKLRSLGIIE